MVKIDDIRLPPRWIELNLTKRECAVFIPTAENEMVCQCGRQKAEHINASQLHRDVEAWTPSFHTQSSPTDTYGTMIFEGPHYPNKAKYVRLSYDTKPELVVELMTLVWGAPLPKLLITVRGGNNDFILPKWVEQILQTGLVRAAKATNAWIVTNGLNKGVAKQIGNAVQHEHGMGFKKGRVVTIGVSPWGVIENRHSLVGRNKEKTYNLLERTNATNILLNPKHSHFFLVDNGSLGKFGGESFFRKQLEKYISMLPTSANRGCDTPVVCVLIEGGFYTLRNITEYLYDSVPVVVFNTTGRTADLIAGICMELDKGVKLESLKTSIYNKMKHIYKLDDADSDKNCEMFYKEIERICAKRDLLTIYNPRSDEESFDEKLLGSIFRSSQWTALQQLSLTLVWDRVDIARKEVFTQAKDWSRETLEHAMMEALLTDRLQFINLLIEHGLNMQKFLTPKRLESLYSVERAHSKVMLGILFEILKPHQQQYYRTTSSPLNVLTLHDIGLAMNKMMGHIYKSKYVSPKYTIRHHEIRRKHNGENTINEMDESSDEDDEVQNGQAFFQPFGDLFLWAVLSKRHSMALLLWPHGPGALAKALVAVKLNRFISEELESVDTNVSSEFNNYALEWETLSYELLDTSFKNDPSMARRLLTMELDEWSNQTCLTLAVMANHRMFLGHPCCQTLLADLWMGALNFKTHIELKVVFGIFFPFLIFFWDFKSVEELKLLPHEEKHHEEGGEAEEEHGQEGTTDLGVDESAFGLFRKSRASITSSLFRLNERKDTESSTDANVKHNSSTGQHRHRRQSIKNDSGGLPHNSVGNETILMLQEDEKLQKARKHHSHSQHHHKDHQHGSRPSFIGHSSSEAFHEGSSEASNKNGTGNSQGSTSESSSSNNSSMQVIHEGHYDHHEHNTSVHQQARQLYNEIVAEQNALALGDTRFGHQHHIHFNRDPHSHPQYDHHHHHPRRYGFMDFHRHRKHEASSSFETTKKELTPWKKFIEFQQAPVTNFYRHAIAYIVFVCCLSYIILIPQNRYQTSPVEIYIIVYLGTMGLEIIREVMSIDAYNWSLKLSELKGKVWAVCDLTVICFFMIGVGLRFSMHDESELLLFRYGMLIYRVSSVYWNLRLYKYMTVHKFLGPKLVMMSKMLKHMAYFAVIIFVVLLAFGLAREAIRFPDVHPSWHNILVAFLEPYVMMFGEVDSDSLVLCGEEGQLPCPIGHWIIPLFWIIYMMVANILIVNVLIAVFNGIYSEVDSIALEVWLFQRFTFVMEFERKPLLPPPFIIICHVFYIIRWFFDKCFKSCCGEEFEEKGLEVEPRKVILGNDHSLKSFLTPAEMNQAFDFELDNVDSMYSTNREDNETTNVLRKAGIIGIGANIHMAPGINEHQGLGQERFGLETKVVAALRTQVRELGSEIEGQRIRLDKLIGILESKLGSDHNEPPQPVPTAAASGAKKH